MTRQTEILEIFVEAAERAQRQEYLHGYSVQRIPTNPHRYTSGPHKGLTPAQVRAFGREAT